MESLSDIVSPVTSNDITRGVFSAKVVNRERPQPSEEDYARKSGECKTIKLSPEEIEAQLAEISKHWRHPVNPITTQLHKPTKPTERPAKKKNANLSPEHLRADRLRQLAAEGKTKADIMTMYRFKDIKQFNQRAKELGCGNVFDRKSRAV